MINLFSFKSFLMEQLERNLLVKQLKLQNGLKLFVENKFDKISN